MGYFCTKSRIEKYSKLQLLKMLRGISNVLRIWGRSYPPLRVKERLLETVRFLKFQGSRIVIFQIEFQYKEPKYKCFPVIFQYPSDFSITSVFQIFPVSSIQCPVIMVFVFQKHCYLALASLHNNIIFVIKINHCITDFEMAISLTEDCTICRKRGPIYVCALLSNQSRE